MLAEKDEAHHQQAYEEELEASDACHEPGQCLVGLVQGNHGNDFGEEDACHGTGNDDEVVGEVDPQGEQGHVHGARRACYDDVPRFPVKEVGNASYEDPAGVFENDFHDFRGDFPLDAGAQTLDGVEDRACQNSKSGSYVDDDQGNGLISPP